MGLAWSAVLGYIRIATHPRMAEHPLPAERACAHVESWLAQPQVALIHPGERHATILFELLRRLGTAGNLTSDAHLAALAIEHQAEVVSTDADFARFQGLRRRNPFARCIRGCRGWRWWVTKGIVGREVRGLHACGEVALLS